MQAASIENTALKGIREQFPVLHQQVNGKPLIYLDNAATSQTPEVVVNTLKRFYNEDHANIHRGVHTLAERATLGYEEARDKAQAFINAPAREEVIFTKGTTESINLVAQSWGLQHLQADQEIILTQLEHHSNIVPWQLVARQTGAKIRVVPVSPEGELLLDAYKDLLSEKTGIVSVGYVSNALGTVNPVREMAEMAHKAGAKILVDAAQAAPHMRIDVQELDCDFLALSSHKMYGPTGVGVLYGKKHLLEEMSPYQGGGEMIRKVSFEGTTYNELPYKFEAGTPDIGGVTAFGAAIDFMNGIGTDVIALQEETLLQHGTALLSAIDKVKLVGTASKKASVISFLVDDVHPYDIGQLLDARGIAVRTGHHCTQPLMEFLGMEGTVRASFAIYNTIEEIDYFGESLQHIINKFV